MRLPIILIAILLLAGCISPVQRQPTPSPTSTPQPAAPAIALPAAQEMAGWRLTTDEIEYIRLFRVGFTQWTPRATGKMADVITRYRNDPAVLDDNQWRVQATGAAGGLRDAYLWFNPASPSAHFEPFGASVAEAVALFGEAGDLLAQGIDASDGAQIERAAQRTQDGVALLLALDAAFSALVGPPDE